MALPRGAMGWSAVCDCGISLSYSLTISDNGGMPGGGGGGMPTKVLISHLLPIIDY